MGSLQHQISKFVRLLLIQQILRMADSKDDDKKTMITVQVKTPKEKQSVEIEEGASIRKFKEAISVKFNNAPIENLCLIFAGKILKDSDNLGAHNIKDGMTIHLVIKQGEAASAASSSSSSSTPATTAAASSG